MCNTNTSAEDVATFLIEDIIERETMAPLKSEDFSPIGAISLITPELLNRHFGCLPLGQQLLLYEAVKHLLQNKKERKPTCTEERQLKTPEDLLDVWENCLPPQSSVPEAIETGRKKLWDIPTYVSFHAPSTTPLSQELSLVDGCLCITERKQPMEKNSVPQYREAAMKIHHKIMTESRFDEASNYLIYIQRITRLAQVFTWPSFLLFDQEFRKQQVENEISWCTESLYLMS